MYNRNKATDNRGTASRRARGIQSTTEAVQSYNQAKGHYTSDTTDEAGKSTRPREIDSTTRGQLTTQSRQNEPYDRGRTITRVTKIYTRTFRSGTRTTVDEYMDIL